MITKKSHALAALLCTAMLLTLAIGCQPAEPKPSGDSGGKVDTSKYGGLMTFRSAYDLQRPNFFLTGDGPSGSLRNFIYDRLFCIDAKANLVPRLATGYEVSDDGLTYTVSLRKGVKWHDGEAFTADDIVFYYDYHKRITSVDKKKDMEETVAKVDDYTVKFVLPQPDSSFPYGLGYIALPEHVWSKIDPSTWDQVSDPSALVGLGPFKFVEHKVGEYVKMERFDDYWEGKPYLDGIIFQVITDKDAAAAAFESGQVNLMTVDYAEYESLNGKEGFSFKGFSSGNMRVVLMNHNDPRLSQLPVRTALSYLMDRDTMIRVNQVKAVPMASCFTPADLHYNPSTADASAFEYSVEKATKVLEDNGWKLNSKGVREKDGQILEFEMLTWISNNPSGVVVIDSCKKAGISITMKTVDTALFVDRVFGEVPEYELAYNGMTMGPTPFGYTRMYSEGAYTTYVNDGLKEKFDRAKAATKQEDAQKLISEIQEEVTKDRALLWLYSAEQIWGTNSNLNLDESGLTGRYASWISPGKAYFAK